MWMDEYVFYRLSSDLPKYSTTADWFIVDRPAILNPSIDWTDKGLDQRTALRLVYDTPIYTHTPLAPILVWPFVKIMNVLADKGVIKHLEQEDGYTSKADSDNKLLQAEDITKVLRFIPILLFIASMGMIFKLMYRKVGIYACLFAMPVATGAAMMAGNYLFYWDAFMMFFFVLTLYIMEVHPNSKWKYVTACCLINTKLFIGFVFLAPLVVHALVTNWRTGWKMALPALAIVPHYLMTVWVTKDWLYVVTHYTAQIPIHDFMYTLATPLEWLATLLGFGMPFYLAMTVPILFLWRKYPAYTTLYILGMSYAWGTGLGITHMSTLPYVGALVWPLVAYEWKIIPKVQRWLVTKKATVNG